MSYMKDKMIEQMNNTDFLVKVDSDMKEVDKLYIKSLKAISQTNDVKMKKLIEKENRLSLMAYETAIIALYDYRMWFINKDDARDKEKIIEIDFALNRLNQLIQEM